LKVSIVCDSLLLQNSLKIFLKDFISTYKHCDLVLSDRQIDIQKPLVIVNSSPEADLQVPFSKSELLLKMEEMYNEIYQKQSKDKVHSQPKKNKKELWKLEREIDKITLEFREKLIKTLRDFYE